MNIRPQDLLSHEPTLWFRRQKVLGANIHETEGLLERSIAFVGRICKYRLQTLGHVLVSFHVNRHLVLFYREG